MWMDSLFFDTVADMQRGYIRTIRGNPAARQREALEEAGVAPIYEGPTPEEAISTLRVAEDGTPDELAIAGSLRILADNRETLHLAMSLVREQGCVVVDILTGRKADGEGAAMAIEAIQEMSRVKASHLNQSKASRKRWGKKTKPTARKQALPAWRDTVKYPKPEDALASPDMEGWSRAWAYRKLGKRHPPY